MSSRRSTAGTSPRPTVTRIARVAALCALAAATLTACGASEEELTGIGADLPSVTGVSVGMPVEDDKDLPVDPDSRVVEVTMQPEASATEVLAVFDAYSDFIEGDDLGAVAVVLESPNRPRLAAGNGGSPTGPMVEALLAARDDADSEHFTLYVDADKPRVTHRLRNEASFASVAKNAEAHAALKGVKQVLVSAGSRSLALTTNEDQNVVARARAELVTVLDSDFDLVEARVDGSGDLTLVVEPQSLPAATVFVNETVDRFHGKVYVQS